MRRPSVSLPNTSHFVSAGTASVFFGYASQHHFVLGRKIAQTFSVGPSGKLGDESDLGDGIGQTLGLRTTKEKSHNLPWQNVGGQDVVKRGVYL